MIADDSFTDIAVDTVRCAMSQLAQPIKIHVVPWARAQNMAKNDKVAGFFPHRKTVSETNMQLSAMLLLISIGRGFIYRMKHSNPVQNSSKKMHS